MKVLHVVNISFVLPYYIGEQFDYFQNIGVEFYIVCSPSTHLNKYAAEKKFKFLSIPILRSVNIISDIKAIFKIRRYIRQNDIDVVIAHTPKGGLVGMFAALLSGVKKRIYFRHGLMYETSNSAKRFLLKIIEKLTGFLAVRIVSVSPSVLEVSQRLNPNKINIILHKGTSNGIDLERFSSNRFSEEYINELKDQLGISSTDKIIGYVGRLVRDKGIEELIAAWQLVKQQFPEDIKLLLVGPFEERDGISATTKELILQDHTVVKTGLVEDTSIYYCLMDIFILPSYREGFPTVVLEASAMQIPVITTKATGCVDSISEGFTGRFTKIMPIDIANNINYYLENPQIAKKHGENGYKFVNENYNQNIVWNEIRTKVLDL